MRSTSTSIKLVLLAALAALLTVPAAASASAGQATASGGERATASQECRDDRGRQRSPGD